MAHAAVTTADRHFSTERFARGGIGQAGVTAEPFSAWIDDWRMTGGAAAGDDPLSNLQVSARGPDFSYDIDLTASGPLALHGDKGYSVKSAAGQASYYYSQAFYTVTGTVAPAVRAGGGQRPGLARPRVVITTAQSRPDRLGLAVAAFRRRLQADGFSPAQPQRRRLYLRHLDRPRPARQNPMATAH